MTDNLKTIVEDIDYLLGEMAEGNFDVRTKAEANYIGDFHNILLSVRKLHRKLSIALGYNPSFIKEILSGRNKPSLDALINICDYFHITLFDFFNIEVDNIILYKEIYNEYHINEQDARLYLYTDEDFEYPLQENEFDKLKLEYKVCLDNAHAGSEVGKIDISLDNRLLKSLKLFTINKIDKLIDSNTLTVSELLWEEKFNEN